MSSHASWLHSWMMSHDHALHITIGHCDHRTIHCACRASERRICKGEVDAGQLANTICSGQSQHERRGIYLKVRAGAPPHLQQIVIHIKAMKRVAVDTAGLFWYSCQQHLSICSCGTLLQGDKNSGIPLSSSSHLLFLRPLWHLACALNWRCGTLVISFVLHQFFDPKQSLEIALSFSADRGGRD